MKKIRWDSNWERLTVNKKLERLRQAIYETENIALEEGRSGRAAASTALYVANLSR